MRVKNVFRNSNINTFKKMNTRVILNTATSMIIFQK